MVCGDISVDGNLPLNHLINFNCNYINLYRNAWRRHWQSKKIIKFNFIRLISCSNKTQSALDFHTEFAAICFLRFATTMRVRIATISIVFTLLAIGTCDACDDEPEVQRKPFKFQLKLNQTQQEYATQLRVGSIAFTLFIRYCGPETFSDTILKAVENCSFKSTLVSC